FFHRPSLDHILKAVIPVVGLGCRILRGTADRPKEVLSVFDETLIQYAAEEAIADGVNDLIFISGRNKRAIEDHFDSAPELEADLAAKNKTELLHAVQNVIPSYVNCIYTRQPAPLGLGHAVLCAAPIVGNEPFVVILADDLIDAQTPVTRQLVEAAHQQNGSVLGINNVERSQTNKYGIISGPRVNDKTSRVEGIVEKPLPEDAPTTLAVVGRYVLEPEIFEHL